MIVKEKTSPVPADKLGRAGYEAEKQMAFYLRRAFAEASDVFVFNDLRLERAGECAQIDHLVLHRFGFVIVESKSAVEKLVVNARGEFSRKHGGKERGMQSPIQQARLQAQLLSRLLNDHKQALRRKVLLGMRQGYFGKERFRILVAVSDRGIIERKGCDPPELCKAESIADKIRAIIQTHERVAGVGGFARHLVADKKTAARIEKDYLPPLTEEERRTLKDFLLQRHAPLAPPIASASPATPPPLVRSSISTPGRAPVEPRGVAVPGKPTCRHCARPNLTILHGRYGYYFKCGECQGNTPIDATCGQCGEKARVRKAGREFKRCCERCGAEAVFHVNSEP